MKSNPVLVHRTKCITLPPRAILIIQTALQEYANKLEINKHHVIPTSQHAHEEWIKQSTGLIQDMRNLNLSPHDLESFWYTHYTSGKETRRVG